MKTGRSSFARLSFGGDFAVSKTTGELQQRLRLNAKTLQTYEQVREVILEHDRSRLLVDSWDWFSYQNFSGWHERWPEATLLKGDFVTATA